VSVDPAGTVIPVQPPTVQVPCAGVVPVVNTMPVTVRPDDGDSANATPVASLPPLFTSVTVYVSVSPASAVGPPLASTFDTVTSPAVGVVTVHAPGAHVPPVGTITLS